MLLHRRNTNRRSKTSAQGLRRRPPGPYPNERPPVYPVFIVHAGNDCRDASLAYQGDTWQETTQALRGLDSEFTMEARPVGLVGPDRV